LVGRPEGRRSLGRPRHIWEDNIKWIFKKWAGKAWTGLLWLTKGDVTGACEGGNEPSGSLKCGEFFK